MVMLPVVGELKSDPKEVAAEAWALKDGPEIGASMESAVVEVRACELCGATQTPMWRRGPSGKGSVCNACGVRWASRRRGARKLSEDSVTSQAKEAHAMDSEPTGGSLEQYYCKYCGLTWPLNFFKNRQQFGAHCSNCSRKRKSRELTNPAANALEHTPTVNDYSLQGHSPTGPFLPHLNLRAAYPRKAPKDELKFINARLNAHAHESHDLDEWEDMYPPAKKSKTLIPNAPDSGDETYYESDSETVSSPYGPSANSLYRLLGAVENVLTEEREMATAMNQMHALRSMIDSLDETRKTTLLHLEHSLFSQLEYLQRAVTPAAIASAMERQQAEAKKEQAQEMQNTVSTTLPPASSQVPEPTSSPAVSVHSPQPVVATPNTALHSATEVQEAQLLQNSILAVQTAEAHIEAAMGPHVDAPPAVVVPPVTLPAELEKAAGELIAIFTNATVLQMGSQADIEAFKNMFVHILNQAKASINQDVATLFEVLVSLKARQTALGQGTFIDHMQIRALTNDLQALKQRVVSSSRAIQNMFVQLVSQFSEQIETAKIIYQENAGNHVRLLDEVVRSRVTPNLVKEVDQLRSDLLTHINCVHANLAYLDTLVLSTE